MVPRPGSPQTASHDSSSSSRSGWKAVGVKVEQRKAPASAYKCEIFGNFVEPKSNINAFLAEFAPASTLPPKCPDKSFNAKIYTGGGREQKMREQSVKGLKSVVRKFPAAKRLKFHDLNRQKIRAPYAMCDDRANAHRIGVCATLPELDGIPPLARWRNLALVFDIHSRAEDDPMAKNSAVHEGCFQRLMQLAQNTLLAQGKLYVFLVGIYGRRARLYRLDRSGAVCSPLFNYTTEPHILHDFLWRFVHPKFDGCVVLGDDPAVKRGTRTDRSLVLKLAKQYDPEYECTAESRKAIRRVTVTQDDGEKATYLVYKLIHTDADLSRASTVWEAFALNSDGETTGKRVVIKEAWQITSIPSETLFYRDLQEAVAASAESGTEPSLSGIVKFEGCNDLGAREVETFAHGTPRPGYRTMQCEGSNVDERNFVRMVFGTIGTPLTEFKSTYGVACALRDAIEGHRQAYQLGLIHRDISVGNVMMEIKADETVGGFIHDLDYAFSWKRFLADAGLPVDLETWERYVREEHRRVTRKRNGQHDKDDKSNRSQSSRGTSESSAQVKKNRAASEFHVDPALQHAQKAQTGTKRYMAVEVLDVDEHRDTHEARHDLESFFWLFVWLVLRNVSCHTCGPWPVEVEYDALFGWSSNRWSKRHFISDRRMQITIEHNKPLTTLLESFRQLCKTNYRSGDEKEDVRWMTHEDVLKLFHEALEDPTQWPDDDNAKMEREPSMEPAYSPGWDYQSNSTAALTTETNHSIPEQDLPPVPIQAEEEVLPQPDPALTAAVEPQRNSDGGNTDAVAALAEEEARARATSRPVHAMETRARAAARTRAAQAAGAGEAQQQRRSGRLQGQKRRHEQEAGVVVDGPGTSRRSKRPRTAAPSRRARGPQKKT
ncbi:hypothetical protein FOMPIDRAFT_82542 [Fomitopsis schrenkii]|uniref:Fungal-type protein kinase domain-containing protein n=1 Tax=Fomitopsis schrenkii TaxID=2126942 RepID=S8FME0_FOMSC|nr:hypothetical protein FOMPIDRAFT_82542 [Fomitopsis schrenkii]